MDRLQLDQLAADIESKQNRIREITLEQDYLKAEIAKSMLAIRGEVRQLWRELQDIREPVLIENTEGGLYGGVLLHESPKIDGSGSRLNLLLSSRRHAHCFILSPSNYGDRRLQGTLSTTYVLGDENSIAQLDKTRCDDLVRIAQHLIPA